MGTPSLNESLLIIEDDSSVRRKLKQYFEKDGYKVVTESTGKTGVHNVKEHLPAVVICGFDLPEYTGIEILQKIKIVDPRIQVIIITENSNVKVAVRALKKGAFDYVTRPLIPEEISATVKSAFKQARKKTTSRNKRKSKVKYIAGPSRQSQNVLKNIELIAPTDLSVVIQGETGTGKEYTARLIHARSRRAKKKFIAVDCGALPEDLAGSELFGHVKGAFTGATSNRKGCFERADGGTLFLDEIANLSYENQTKLLRALQERVIQRIGGEGAISVDVRVIAASNEDLRAAVEKGSFREDIFHRINEFRIELSPLRERVGDIELFALRFLDKANKRLGKSISGFDDEALSTLQKYQWSGNIRELRNLVRRAVLLCQKDVIDIGCLPEELSQSSAELESQPNHKFQINQSTLRQIVEAAERDAIVEAIRRAGNNKAEAARVLDIDRTTLYNKIKQYGIKL